MKRGQSTLEYIILIGAVAVAVIAMLVYISRGFQGNIRDKADQIGSGQYGPGKTIVDNTETKHVVSTIVSEGTTKVKLGGKEEEAVALQKEINDKLAEQRQIKRTLAKLNKEYQNAALADALAGTKNWTPWGIVGDLFSSLFGQKQSTAEDYEKQTYPEKIAETKSQIATLNIKLADVVEKAKTDASYQETVDMLNEQLKDLNDTLDVLILNAKKEYDQAYNAWLSCEYCGMESKPVDDSTPEDKARLNVLMGDESKTIDEVINAKNKEIEDRVNDKSKAIAGQDQQSQPTQAEANEQKKTGENYFNTLIAGLKIMKAPPKPKVDSSGALPRSIGVVVTELATARQGLAKNEAEYTALLNDLDKLQISPDQTSAENINTEDGTITIHKITKETLGNF